MKITEAARLRRHLYRLSFSEGEPVEVDVRTFDESPYRVGDDITADALEALLSRSQYDRAYDRALYLLGLRDYACHEMEKKLLTEASPEVAAQVVERLCQLGLLNDERYAANAARSMSRYKQYPRRRIEQELRRRGVDTQTAQTAADEVETEDFELALALIEKKYYNKMNDPDSRQRVAAALARRGFSYGAVRQAMTRFLAGQDTDSEEFEDTWQ
ncbi:MAG: regulatory protein RecX [Clostridia bacterium]|nr:regulatory protein RecX [Clostridia bacterium]